MVRQYTATQLFSLAASSWMRADTLCLCALPSSKILSPSSRTLTLVLSQTTAAIPREDSSQAVPQPTPTFHSTSPLAQSTTTNSCSMKPATLLPLLTHAQSCPSSMLYKFSRQSSEQMRLQPSPPFAMKSPQRLQEMEETGYAMAQQAKVMGLGQRLRNSGRVFSTVAMESTWSILLAAHTFSTWDLISLKFLGKRLRRKGQTCGLNLTPVCISSMIFPSVLV